MNSNASTPPGVSLQYVHPLCKQGVRRVYVGGKGVGGGVGTHPRKANGHIKDKVAGVQHLHRRMSLNAHALCANRV